MTKNVTYHYRICSLTNEYMQLRLSYNVVLRVVIVGAESPLVSAEEIGPHLVPVEGEEWHSDLGNPQFFYTTTMREEVYHIHGRTEGLKRS